MNGKTLTTTVFMVLAVALSPAAAGTHLGQPNTGRHVTLVGAPSGPNVCGTVSFSSRNFFRVFPNGTQDGTPFMDRSGYKHLVVTDVEWSAYGGPNGTVPLAAGQTMRLKIFLVGGLSSAQVFSSRSITLDASTAGGRPGTSEQLTAGFVVDPDVSICPYVYQEAPGGGAAVYIDEIILRGYID